MQSSVDVHISECYTVELEHLLETMKIYQLRQQQSLLYSYMPPHAVALLKVMSFNDFLAQLAELFI